MSMGNDASESRATDWERFLRQHNAGAEVRLDELRAGDVLLVETDGSRYTLRMHDTRTADLTTDRKDRPSGRVVVQGCTFGCSSSIKPDALFCGGNLEFTFDAGRMVHRTSRIRSLATVRAAAAKS